MLNVAVGISAGVGALTSAVPVLHAYTLPLCLGILAAITVVNLRGTKESGIALAVPTYLFIASLGAILVVGVYTAWTGGGQPQPVIPPSGSSGSSAEAVTLWSARDVHSRASGLADTPFELRRRDPPAADALRSLGAQQFRAAQDRGATVLGEIAGYGSTSDAYHLATIDTWNGTVTTSKEADVFHKPAVTLAALIFATTFRRARVGSVALASNLLGAVLGGAAEYASLAYGIRSLSVLAVAMYASSLVFWYVQQRSRTASHPPMGRARRAAGAISTRPVSLSTRRGSSCALLAPATAPCGTWSASAPSRVMTPSRRAARTFDGALPPSAMLTTRSKRPAARSRAMISDWNSNGISPAR